MWEQLKADFDLPHNLLCLCIVDESMEVARFLYDGDSYYEDLSFNSLERETGDGSYTVSIGKVFSLYSTIIFRSISIHSIREV